MNHEAGILELDSFSELSLLARSLHVAGADLTGTLDAIAQRTTTVIEAATWSGIVLLRNTQLEPQATCGEPPHVLDNLQCELQDGPCYDSSRSQQVIHIPNMHEEARWPEVAQRASELGVLAMLCVPLWVDERRLGALSLYATSTDAFDSADTQLTEMFATLSSLALADAQRIANMRIALETRDVIGQAKGILMERFRITAEAAFEVLSTASQQTNEKLPSIAQKLVETGIAPPV